MTARTCKGETAAGQPCRHPPSRDSDYCLAHDPERKAEHAEVSRMGGVARHDPETSGLKAEVRELMTAMRSGKVSAGVGSVLLQAIRLLRELEADDRLNDSGDTLIESIAILRRSNIPDLSEPAANAPPGGMTSATAELDAEHDAWLAERQAKQDERERIQTAPLDELTTAERWERKRLALGKTR